MIGIDCKDSDARLKPCHNFVTDHETILILFSRSPFELPCCRHFCGQKLLPNDIKSRKCFVAAPEVTIIMDSLSCKADTMQHIPILDTLA